MPVDLEKRRAYQKAWAKTHPDKIAAAQKRYAQTDKGAAAQKAWAKTHPDKIAAAQKRYAQTPKGHKVRHEASMRSLRKRRKSDPIFRMVESLRLRVRLAIKGFSKAATTMKLVGCSPGALRAHLESKFRPGMNWENYGLRGWHIDHIRPCASFDMSDPEQQRQCFHYLNLQPLWAVENLKKGAR